MPSELVLITGATGFIGLHVLHRTLLTGRHVRAAIRTPDGEQRILSALSRAGLPPSYNSNLSFVVVPDIISPTAYTAPEILSGVSSIIHVASPLAKQTTDYEKDVIQPAIQGTTNILNAALAQPRGSIKRVVITSSIVTLVDVALLASRGTEKVYNEDDKATTVLNANPFLAYVSSKILAQRAVHDFVKNHPYTSTSEGEGKRGFTVATIHPSFVMGHNYIQTEYSTPAPGTNNILWAIVAPAPAPEKLDPQPETTVSVIDVADAHVRALTVEVDDEDKVEEFLLATPSEQVRFDKVEEYTRKLAEEDEDVKSVLGELVFKQKLGGKAQVDVKKAENKLGIKWRSFEDQVRDIVKQQVKFYKQREVGN